jgi:hypothetical protein
MRSAFGRPPHTNGETMRQSVILSALGMVLLATGGVQLAAQQPALPVQVLKVSSGPSGSEVNGNFVLTSERSVFNRNDDRQVIVLFQWDAVPGPHRLVAQWRSPDSATTSSSTVNYIAKGQRFGAYWSLPLSASMTLGTWSIEATVDGVPAGRLTFEVTDNRVSSPPGKSMLTQASLYERLNRAFVVLQRTSKVGRELSPTAGFSPAPGLIYTAMSTLDGADEILMVSRDGATTPATIAPGGRHQGRHPMCLDGRRSRNRPCVERMQHHRSRCPGRADCDVFRWKCCGRCAGAQRVR